MSLVVHIVTMVISQRSGSNNFRITVTASSSAFGTAFYLVAPDTCRAPKRGFKLTRAGSDYEYAVQILRAHFSGRVVGYAQQSKQA